MSAAADVAAEQALVGALLTSAEAIEAALGLVQPDDFADRELAAIFSAAVALHREGVPVDPVTVHERVPAASLADLTALVAAVPSVGSAAAYARTVADRARRRRAVQALQQASIEASRPDADLGAIVRGLQREVPHGGAAPFTVVPVADLAHRVPEPPAHWWRDYVPAGVVTLLGAHGGVGKSTLALMLAVAISTGRDLFNVPTRRGVVVFYSAEDGAGLVRYRLHRLCGAMGVDVADLVGRLHILDATEDDPALFREVTAAGKRYGTTTAAYDALREYVEQVGADVLIVDNASDTFDASENDRARVRGFMRALANIAHPARGLVLLAHVDKATARGLAGGGDAYSGSTAWHNSARSRLFLNRNAEGGLTLEHQKANLAGKPREPLTLHWPEGGIPTADEPVSPFLQGITDRNDTRALLELVHEFYSRGEWIAPDVRSRYNAAKVFKGEARLPSKRKPAELFALLRNAERSGLLCRETYRDRNRKEHERWALTAKGLDHIGAAPSAPCAPCSVPGAHPAPSAQGAPCAPCAHRGYGGVERAQNTAQADEGDDLRRTARALVEQLVTDGVVAARERGDWLADADNDPTAVIDVLDAKRSEILNARRQPAAVAAQPNGGFEIRRPT